MDRLTALWQRLKDHPINLGGATLIVTLVTASLGCLDFMISSEISFSVFYLIPITLAVFLSGRRLAFVFSVICAVVWIAADIASGLVYSSWYVPVWNTLVRLIYFIFHSMLLSQLLLTIQTIEKNALHDALTKVANWRYFEQYTQQLLHQADRKPVTMTLAYIDLDHFKQVNDSLGHGVGDQVLIVISSAIQAEIRAQDLLARLGGDEFALVLLDAQFEDSSSVLQRIRSAVETQMRLNGWPITLSIGAMVFARPSLTIEPMLKIVDDLMYEVKKSGKNNIKIIQQPVVTAIA